MMPSDDVIGTTRRHSRDNISSILPKKQSSQDNDVFAANDENPDNPRNYTVPTIRSFKNFVPYFVATMMGSLTLIRYSWIVGSGGIILSIFFNVICGVVLVITAISLQAIDCDGSHNSKNLDVFHLLKRKLGKEFASSVSLVFFVGSTILSAIYYLAAAEVMTWHDTHKVFDVFTNTSWSHVIISILLIVVSGLLALTRNRSFLSHLFLFVLIIVILVNISIIVGISQSSYTQTDLYKTSMSVMDTRSIRPDFTSESRFGTLLGLLFPAFLNLGHTTEFTNLSRKQSYNRQSTLPAVSLSALLVIVLSSFIIFTYGFLLSRTTLSHEKLVTVLFAWPSPLATQIGLTISLYTAALFHTLDAMQLLGSIVNEKSIPFLNFLRPHYYSTKTRYSPFTFFINSNKSNPLHPATSAAAIPVIPLQLNDDDDKESSHADQDTSVHPTSTTPAGHVSSTQQTGNGPPRLSAITQEDSVYINLGDLQTPSKSHRLSTLLHYNNSANTCCGSLCACISNLFGYCFSPFNTYRPGDSLPGPSILFVIVATMIICLAADLDHLASLASIIYMIVYACINGLCMSLILLKGSKFIKTSRFYGWRISLIGMLLCLTLALLVNWWLFVIVLFLTGCVWAYSLRVRVNQNMSDALYGVIFQMAHNLLLILSESIYPKSNYEMLSIQATPRVTHPLAAAQEKEGAKNTPPGQIQQTSSSSSHPPTSQDWRPRIFVIVCLEDRITEAKSRSASSSHIPLTYLNSPATTTAPPHTNPAVSPTISPGIDLTRTRSQHNPVTGDQSATGHIRYQSSSGLKVETENMIRLASHFKSDQSLVMVGAFIQNELNSFNYQLGQSSEKKLYRFLHDHDINAFPRVCVSPDMHSSILTSIQTIGVGAMSPNTVMIEWLEKWSQLPPEVVHHHVDIYKSIEVSKKTLIVLKGCSQLPSSPEFQHMLGTIDIWWILHDGSLLTLLSHLLTLHDVWKNCTLRLFLVMTRPDQNPERFVRKAKSFLMQANIIAEVEAVDLDCPHKESLSMYERTLDLKSKLKLVADLQKRKGAALNSNPTMTSAVYNEPTVKVESHEQTKRRNITDIFGLSTKVSEQNVTALNNHSQDSADIDKTSRVNLEVQRASGGVGSILSVDTSPQSTDTAHTTHQNTATTDPTTTTTAHNNGHSNNTTSTAADTKGTASSHDEVKPTATDHTYTKDSVAQPHHTHTHSHHAGDDIIKLTRETKVSGTEIVMKHGALEKLAKGVSTVMTHDFLSKENRNLALKAQSENLGRLYRVDPKKLQVALSFNQLLRTRSKEAKLVVTNLPLIRRMEAAEVMAYITCLTENVQPVMLVRGSGQEIITSYNV